MQITAGVIEHVKTYNGNRKGGCEAKFTPINRDWGFKHYATEHRAMVNYARQKWGHQFGLAPQVGEFTKFGTKGFELFGYITERAREITKSRFEKDVDQFVYSRKLRYIGYKGWNFDLEFGNVGLNKDNKIVIIDWGWGPEKERNIQETDIGKILNKHGYNIENYIKRYPI